MTRHLDPFYSAKASLKLLHADIEQLEVRSRAFVNQGNLKHFTERDSNTGELVHKVRVVNDIPDDIDRDAVRFLAEIRSALDKAVHGAAVLLGSRSLKHSNFPFGDGKGGENAFTKQLASETGIWRGIPPEIHAYLLELAPYPLIQRAARGNDMLALLGRLSNPAKHQNVLMVNLNINGVAINHMSGRNFFFPRVATIWNEAKNECEVFRLAPTSGQMRYTIPTFISLNQGGKIAQGDFTRTLREMARMAESIVLGIEAKTSEALKAREHRADGGES